MNEKEYHNSYVCSPYSHYVSAAVDELKKVDHGLLKWMLTKLIRGLGVIFKWGLINKTVCVNNWLIPTNLYPEISCKEIHEITSFLKDHFPGHTIQFRSLNGFTNKTLMQNLQSLNYQMILSRQVYLIDGSQSNAFSANMFKKDLVLLNKSSYQFSPLENCHVERAVTFYKAIYMDKYSSHNPQFTSSWVELVAKSECWKLRAIQKSNDIDAVFASISLGPTMTMPFFGYDTSLPQTTGLYRMISARVALDSKEKGMFLNMSAGASSFKRLRRATSQLEYTAINTEKLPLRQKLPWKLLHLMLNRLGAYLLQKFDH